MQRSSTIDSTALAVPIFLKSVIYDSASHLIREESMRKTLLVLMAVLPVASSCTPWTWFAPPTDYPVIERNLGQVGVAATTADRRAIIVHRDTGFVATEPPPDAMQQVSSNEALKFDASGNNGQGVEGKVVVQHMKEIERRLKLLTKRSQGIIFLRDATYRLSEGAYNDFIARRLQSIATVEKRDLESGHRVSTPAAVRVIGAGDKWLTAFTAILEKTQTLILAELAVNPTLTSNDNGIVLPQRFEGTADEVEAGKTLTIYVHNHKLAGQTVEVVAMNGLFASKSSDKQTLIVSLKTGGGFGSKEFTVPMDWRFVYLETADSRSKLILVKKPEGTSTTTGKAATQKKK